MARFRAELKSRDPILITTLGGDYVSPSALGTARVNGERLNGRQMVAVLNAVGIDWATFGNHEFDIPEAALRARLAESKFKHRRHQRDRRDWRPRSPNTVRPPSSR